jgi:hypothetical protein
MSRRVRGSLLRLAIPALAAAGAVMATTVSMSDTAAAAVASRLRWWRGTREYEACAMLEHRRPDWWEALDSDAADEATAVAHRLVSWGVVKDLVADGKIPFARSLDPDDPVALESVYRRIVNGADVRPIGHGALAVSFRAPEARDAAVVLNELLKWFAREDQRVESGSAHTELVLLRKDLAAAKARLTEVDNEIRDHSLANPSCAMTSASSSATWQTPNGKSASCAARWTSRKPCVGSWTRQWPASVTRPRASTRPAREPPEHGRSWRGSGGDFCTRPPRRGRWRGISNAPLGCWP